MLRSLVGSEMCIRDRVSTQSTGKSAVSSMAIQEVWMLLLALGAAGSVAPWCEDTAAPPVPGMYGPMGVELTGPRGSLNQYVDLPPDRELVALFAQGLAQLYGFNNFEALRNFNRTAQISPTCALCHWGIAMSYGPNINSLVQRQDELNLAANAALALSHQQPGLLPKTRDMISSIGCLIQPASHVDSPSSPARRCMARLLSRFSAASPDDDDLAAFSASALMSLSPWDYYNATPSYGPQPLKEFLIPARDNLVRVSNKTGQPHALAIHLMIHLMEPSNAPPSYRSRFPRVRVRVISCLLYTSDAADEEDSVDLGGRRIIKKKKKYDHRNRCD
eukprot:TRINITY_DN43504_c0_g1_i1.p1 TRINITY_DN43504_c0_g1~~TRINITY_DN43504_c0_g1_i1.p1  ORF type:complete len:333 (-),score=76.23 TRINITY_DN43504_c0_g1_i1:89-1087(-)